MERRNMDKLKVVFLGEKTDYWYYSNQAIKARLAEVADVKWFTYERKIPEVSRKDGTRGPCICNWCLEHPNVKYEIWAVAHKTKPLSIIPSFKGYNEQYVIENDALKIVRDANPDIILITDRVQTLIDDPWKNLDKVKVPKVQYAGDPHNDTPYIVDFCIKNKVDMVLLQYFDGIACEYEQKLPNAIIGHLPWCIDKRLFRNYGCKRIIDFICIGHAEEKYYPFRRELWSYIEKQHPFPRLYSITKSPWIGRDKYIEKLNQSKICPFGTSIYKYPLAKFFEAMACGTLVMADKPIDWETLHFIPDVNFVEINRENYKEKLEDYLRNTDEREKIIRNAHKMVMKYHTSIARVNKLLYYFRMLL